MTNLTKALNAGPVRGAFVAASVLASGFATGATAQSVTEKLRGCLTIEDMTKARLDCYDAIVPPVIEDCRLIKQEDLRLNCFDRFLELPVKPTSEVVPVISKPVALSKPAASTTQSSAQKSKGCSLRGLRRLPDGKCTSHKK